MKLIFPFLLAVISPALIAKTFKVGCHDQPPELFHTPHGCIGPVAEVVERAVTRQSYKMQWVLMDWEDSLAAAKAGEIDMLVRHSMDKDRESYLNGIAYGYEILKVNYYVKHSLDRNISELQDLAGLVVGALQDGFYSAELIAEDNIEKRFFNNLSDLVKALETGTVDAVITIGTTEKNRFKILSSVKEAPYFTTITSGQYISIPKKSSMNRYHENIKSEIDKMIINGEIDEIFNHYHLPPPEQL